MKILVTGGAGFIGSNFINYQLKNFKNDILNIDKLTYAGCLDSIESNADNYNFIRADICDLNKVSSIINDYNPNYIINFAAESHVDRSIENPLQFINTNIIGVANLLIASFNYYKTLNVNKNIFRFLHISTDEVYGSLERKDKRFTENTPYNPSSPYAASKAASDHLVLSWYRTYNLPVIITNCSNNYGPYQFPEKLIPLTIINCLLENQLPIYGNGQNIRDWIFVKDHCKAIYKILEIGNIGNTYNIGSEKEVSNIQIVELICSIMDKKNPRKNNKRYKELIQYVPDRPGHDFRYAINNKKIKEQIGWQPSTLFETGIAETIDWYINNLNWWKTKISNKEYNFKDIGILK